MVDGGAPRGARRLLVAAGIVVLLAAGWGGLLHIGWRWPKLGGGAVAFHGPLMVGAFLGTLLSLERAVALRRTWAYAAPLLAAASGAALLFGIGLAGELLQLAAGVILVAIFAQIVRRQPSIFTTAMGLGAAAWVVATLLWLTGHRMGRAVVPWWIAFLVLTIVAERLELSRFLGRAKGKEAAFLGATGLYFSGLIIGLAYPGLGWAVTGLGMVALGAWLATYDLAMRTVKGNGLTRYVAVCLLAGYLWLLVSGGLILAALLLRIGLYPPASSWVAIVTTHGPFYDAVLHAVLVGFVFSMIFGHAPIIFPSVLVVHMDYRPRFFAHLALLELSVVLRVVCDLAGFKGALRWAGLLNGAAILLFLAQTISTVHRRPRARPESARVRQASAGHVTFRDRTDPA